MESGDQSSRRSVLRTLSAGITGAIGLGALGQSGSANATSSETNQSEGNESPSIGKEEMPSLLATLEDSIQNDLSNQESTPPGFSWYRQEAYQWSILYRPEWFILRPAPTQNEEGLQFDPVQFWATSMLEYGLIRDLVVDVTPSDLSLEQAYENYVSRLSSIDQYFAGNIPEPVRGQLRTGQPSIQFAALRANPRGKSAISVTTLSVVEQRLYAMVFYGEPDPVEQTINPDLFQFELDQFINVEVPTIISSFGIGG